MIENSGKKKELVAYFLRKMSARGAENIMDDMENFGEAERHSLYGIIFAKEEFAKQEALDLYIDDFLDIKDRYEHAESKMRQLAKKMEDLLRRAK